MAQHGVPQLFDVVGNDVVAPRLKRQGLAHLHEREAAARGGSHPDVLHKPLDRPGSAAAGGVDDRDDVFLDGVVDVDPLDRVLKEQNVFRGDRILAPSSVERARRRPRQNLDLFGGLRVGQNLFHEEPVHLGFGKDVRALLFDWVLGGHDGEGTREFVDGPSDRRLTLLHRFEHRRLRFCRGPIDFVEKDDVGVHRTELGREGAGLIRVHLRADDVIGHKVRRALDSREGPRHRGGDRRGGRRLGQARHRLEQHVPPCEQGRDEGRIQRVLPHDAAPEGPVDPLKQIGAARQIRGADVARRHFFHCHAFQTRQPGVCTL